MVDPIRFEVIRNALVAATDEMVLTLKRSAYSTNIKTRSDFSCAFFDAELRCSAQGFAQPVHLGSMVEQVPRAVRDYGPENLHPGDAIITNDPFPSGVHLNDVSLISPVFCDGELLGYVANLAHHVDVGGGAPASIGAFREVFQEGVIIPPVKLVEAGRIVPDVFRLLLAQIRSKHETGGDLRAQIAANATGVRRLQALVERFGRETIVATMDELLAYTERRTRAELAALPHGVYEAAGSVDSDGYGDDPVRLRARVEITAGGVRFDLTGSDPQRRAPVNSTYAQTFSACAYALKCLIDPDLPVNDGFYRLVTVDAPQGSVTNCTWPSPVVGGWETQDRVVEVLFRALLPGFPDRLCAGTKGMMCQAGFGSLDIEAGSYTCFYDTFAGGYGARLASDGPDAVQAHGQNTENAPVEETELNYPVWIDRLSLVDDSEGPGRFRGGLGLRKDYRFDRATTFTILADRDKAGPWGAFGGHDGNVAEYVLIRAGAETRLGSKTTVDLEPGDVISVRTCGGGGYGPPEERDPRLVLRDVLEDKVTPERARALYRVAVDLGARRLDDRATSELRSEQAWGADNGMAVRIAIDIGGTFTDATLIDETTGQVSIAKVSTTPSDPSEGFMEAVDRALGDAGIEAAAIDSVVHATTVATNAIIEGKIARSGFVTTDGFRDLLEIARQVRPTLYDTQFEKTRPLIPRDRAVGVVERLGPQGEVLLPLDEGSVRDAAALLRREGVDSVAVCLLHSYVNPEHERRIGAILAEELPGVPVSLSAEVAPEFREYLRASTTVINAAIRPTVERYLERIEQRLEAAGVHAKLLVMQSSGGVFSSEAARRRPVFMVESGPAAGVIASASLGEALGLEDILSFDMGGTTAKVGLIQGGKPSVTKDYQVGGHAAAGIGGISLSGYPVRTPVVDLVEIGAGGGSIAWVDSGGLLRVGPQSAGADPGPVSYRRGGVEPTVTDANAVLGRLNPGYFLGGEIALDVEGARRAIEERCARPLGLDVVEAANGIVEIANAAMVNALHLISVQRGYDPRDFVLVAFGGAGPVHANALARDAEMPTLLVPRSPGIFSATGLLATDLKRDASSTVMRRLDALDPGEVEAAFAVLERAGAAELAAEGLADDAIESRRQIDMRYVGQSYELTIEVGDAFDASSADGLEERFHAEHDRMYGFSAPGEPTECVSLRVTTVGRIAKPPLRPVESSGAAEPREHRPVYFAESGGYVDCPVYDRYRLPGDAGLPGPAVIEELDSTTIVHPGYAVEVDAYGNLIIRREAP